MRKVATFFAIAAVVALSACGGAKTEENTVADEAAEAVQAEMNEAVESIDSTVTATVDSATAAMDSVVN